jgi:hypothetical protein
MMLSWISPASTTTSRSEPAIAFVTGGEAFVTGVSRVADVKNGSNINVVTVVTAVTGENQRAQKKCEYYGRNAIFHFSMSRVRNS